MAPTVDFIQRVYLPQLTKLGVHVEFIVLDEALYQQVEAA